MAETIDEARVIAWVDGELSAEESAWMVRAVAADPALAALANRHRRLKARLTAAFGPIADEPALLVEPIEAEAESAPVISLAAARAERDARVAPPSPARRWAMPVGIAASLAAGILTGFGMGSPSGVADRAGALAVSPKIASALDGQLSGDSGTIRVALSFRDHEGAYCRSFTATHLSGVACKADGAWQLRYAAPAKAAEGDYRQAGTDGAAALVVSAMIDGDPLDRKGEEAARGKGWH